MQQNKQLYQTLTTVDLIKEKGCTLINNNNEKSHIGSSVRIGSILKILVLPSPFLHCPSTVKHLLPAFQLVRTFKTTSGEVAAAFAQC